jgi:hypothetical protein
MGAAASIKNEFDISIFDDAIAEASANNNKVNYGGSSVKSQRRNSTSVRRGVNSRTVESETFMTNELLHTLVKSEDMALAKSFRGALEKRDKLEKLLTEKKNGLDVEYRFDDGTTPKDASSTAAWPLRPALLPHVTPLQQAIVQRNYEAVDVLLQHGADPSARLPCDVPIRYADGCVPAATAGDDDDDAENVARDDLLEGTSTLMLALRNLLDMEVTPMSSVCVFPPCSTLTRHVHHTPPAQTCNGRLPYNWSQACDICHRLLAMKECDVHAGWARYGREESAFSLARERLMSPSFAALCGDEAAAVGEVATAVLRHPSNDSNAPNILRRKSTEY